MNTTFDQLLREANRAYNEGLYGLAAYYIEKALDLCKRAVEAKETPKETIESYPMLYGFSLPRNWGRPK